METVGERAVGTGKVVFSTRTGRLAPFRYNRDSVGRKPLINPSFFNSGATSTVDSPFVSYRLELLVHAIVFGSLVFFSGSMQCAAQQHATGQRFMITSGHRLATLEGLEILRQGGNVVDAAVTTSLCLGVVEPYGSGLGGKLVLLFRDANTGQVHCIEALCPSPRLLQADNFVALPPDQRRQGYHSVGVPGLPAGLYRAHQRWGSLDWSRLVQPAIRLAESGFEVDEQLKSFFDPKVESLRTDAEAARLYLVENDSPPAGTLLARRIGSQCAPGNSLNFSCKASRTSSRRARRVGVWSKSGSFAMSGSPTAKAIRLKIAGLGEERKNGTSLA